MSNRYVPTAAFRGAVFLAALLLFLMEPMAAKELLPLFGGASAVWITCLVFFQVALLLGYLYAHVVTRAQGHAWRRLHWALLGAAMISCVTWAAGGVHLRLNLDHPATDVCLRLLASIGLPFVVLSATSPLMQVWLQRLETGGVRFRLYGLSNVGSLLALAIYPVLIEPHLSLQVQREVWCAGFAVFAMLSAWLASREETEPQNTERVSKEPDVPSPLMTKLLWLLLPMAGAMQLSAVTEHITTNIAAIPLLWIIPLAIYLLTFVIAFQSRRWLPRTILLGLLAVLLYALGNFMTRPEYRVPVGLGLGLFLVELLLACLACHAELYRLRPVAPREATMFYLTMAAGGGAGSFLVGVAAPTFFQNNYDLSLAFVVTAAVVLLALWREGWKQRILWSAVTLALTWFCWTLQTRLSQSVLVSERNFYGSLRVKSGASEEGDTMRMLMHGSIVHGTQIFSPDLMQAPTTYYAPDSGVGLALAACCGGRPRRIGVVGLGVGTLAAYGKDGDSIRFYEINPAVRPIAENWFTYLRQSKASLSFSEGDARASLAKESPQRFDVLVIDAFSGDAIPMHLLTKEAMAIYRRQLEPGGVLAFHVSNQYVDLGPELAALARDAGMQGRYVVTEAKEPSGEFKAEWALLTEDAALFAKPQFAGAALLRPVEGVKAWTDDDSSLFKLVRW